MFSCYNCSSSIDDNALTTALQAVGDCTVSSDCLTAYNEYFGGWATAVGGEIVVGDLTDETIANFNTQYIPLANSAGFASVSWVGESADVSVISKGLVPWSFATTSPVVRQNLNDFTITEDGLGIKSQTPGTYFLTYSIVLEGPTREPIPSFYDVGISGFTNIPDLDLYAQCYLTETRNPVTLSGSCIGVLQKNAIIALTNVSPSTVRVRSVSISIRFISPLPLPT